MDSNGTLLPVSDFRSLVTYGVTTEQIEAKKAAYAALEATTPKGYEEVRKAIGDLRTLRVAVEDRRKELKKDSLEFGRLVDGEAKRITALIEGIEEPLKLKKAAIDDEKDRLRREKEAAEKAALEAKVRAEREAEEARLKAIRDAEEEKNRIEAERLAKEREELERQKAIIAERERVERERMEAEQRRIDEDRRRVHAEKEAADRAEFERQARIKAEADVKAKAEQDAREAEERRVAEEARKAAEAKRLEAMRPDVEKVAAFANLIASIERPTIRNAECLAAIDTAVKRLATTAKDLREFVEKQSKATP